MTLPPEDFPNLTPNNHRVTSPASAGYNCIAWAAENTEHWWEPGRFWPVVWPRDDASFEALVHLFLVLGYESCDDSDLEPGFTKVALYGSTFEWEHAARQLPSGKWVSKLGIDVDIEHDSPDDVSGGIYGEAIEIMKKATRPER